MNTRCPWCRTPVTDEDPDPDTLCRSHLAELEGLSVSELDRMESEQYAEEADSRGWR